MKYDPIPTLLEPTRADVLLAGMVSIDKKQCVQAAKKEAAMVHHAGLIIARFMKMLRARRFKLETKGHGHTLTLSASRWMPELCEDKQAGFVSKLDLGLRRQFQECGLEGTFVWEIEHDEMLKWYCGCFGVRVVHVVAHVTVEGRSTAEALSRTSK